MYAENPRRFLDLRSWRIVYYQLRPDCVTYLVLYRISKVRSILILAEEGVT